MLINRAGEKIWLNIIGVVCGQMLKVYRTNRSPTKYLGIVPVVHVLLKEKFSR